MDVKIMVEENERHAVPSDFLYKRHVLLNN